MKKDLTSEEILKLPQEEFVKYMQEVKNRTYKKNFINSLPNDYTQLCFEKKVEYWVENLNQGMRLQVEKGYDESLVFSTEWYKAFKSIDVEVDNIMNEVFNVFFKYGWSWSKEKYFKRINSKA